MNHLPRTVKFKYSTEKNPFRQGTNKHWCLLSEDQRAFFGGHQGHVVGTLIHQSPHTKHKLALSKNCQDFFLFTPQFSWYSDSPFLRRRQKSVSADKNSSLLSFLSLSSLFSPNFARLPFSVTEGLRKKGEEGVHEKQVGK